MGPDTYLTFLAATIVVLVIPGPTTMQAVSCSLVQGRRAALPLALGVGLVFKTDTYQPANLFKLA